MAETTILLTGKGTDLSFDFSEPLQGDYKIALQSLSTYYSWSNITDKNNSLVYEKDGDEKTIIIPEGAYDVKDLALFIRDKLKSLGDEDAFRLGASFNTGKAVLDIKEGYTVDMIKSSIGLILGFTEKMRYIGPVIQNSDEKIDITSVNEVLVHCNIVEGILAAYDGKLSKRTVLTSFYPDVAPGYKINIDRTKLFYTPVRKNLIQDIRVWLTDQDYQPINNYDEKLTIKLHIKSYNK